MKQKTSKARAGRCEWTGKEGDEMIYCYEVVRENAVNGQQADRTEVYYSNHPLEVGGLYLHLRDLKGAYRVLNELETAED